MTRTTDRHACRTGWHDYGAGIYFITICSRDRKHIFGSIHNDVMHLSALGHLIEKCLEEIPGHHPDTEILNHVVMPNHLHMIISVGTRYIASASAVQQSKGCLKPPCHGKGCEDYHHNSPLAVIIGSFKAAVTRLTRTRCIASLPVWQPRFHEHIIRSQHAYDNIMNYIDNNIINWDKDCFYIV